ncbi:hypothetical protein XM25_00605 [Devosia sp. H5989]|nr:hypothetical protein XM25_00605 [Devosia sp. H5989]
MQTANILLALGGDSGNQVPKFAVTAAEIAVLRAIHGDESVTEIQPLKTVVDRTNRAELGRLRATYGKARDNEGNVIVDMLFPGAAARVFETIDELDLNASLFAAKARHTAADVAQPENQVGDYKALKVAELKDIAAARNIDLGEATKKGEIVELLQAADDSALDESDDEEDEVGDLKDGGTADGSSIFE